MSLRIDTAPWIPGALVIGDTGGGVLGSAIPSTGDNGAGYAYNDLSLPADNGKEICGRITTWPTNGTLTAYEDTSFTYDGASDTFAYQLYVDYVAVGAPTTVTLTMVSASATGTLAATESSADTAAVVGTLLAQGSLTATETGADTAIFTGAGVAAVGSIGAVETGSDTAAFSGSLLAQGLIAAVESGNDTVYIAGQVYVPGSALYPQPAQVALGVTYGPTGVEYVGTLTGGGGPTAADIAAAVWAAATRTLTSGGNGITPTEIWAYTNRTLSVDAVPSALDVAYATRAELATELARLDAAISSRATPGDIHSAM